MGFVGHVFDMIARMKANERRKRRPFDKEVQVKGQMIRQEFLRETCNDDLQNVRERMALQRARERRLKLWVAVIITLLIVIMYLTLHLL